MAKSYTICAHCHKINRYDTDRSAAAVCASCKQPLSIQGPVVELDDRLFKELVAKSPVPVVVDFWAPWCGPCRAFAPTYMQAATSRPGEFVFAKLNTQDHPSPAGQLGIRGIPTLMVFKDGREVGRQAGAMDARTLAGWLNQYRTA